MMDNLEKYLNDPSIAHEPQPLREIHAVRLMIFDKTKSMTRDQLKAYQAKNIEEARNNYGIRFV